MSSLSIEVSTTSIIENSHRVQYCLTPTKVFADLDEAKDYLKKEGVYSYYYSNKDGYVLYYRCKSVKRREKRQCDSKVKLCLAEDSLQVLLFTSTMMHNHHELSGKKIGIPEKTKLVIVDLLKKKVSTAEIIEHLISNGLEFENRRQLTNYLAVERKKSDGPQIISLSDFDNWCNQHSAVPEDENAPFVLNHEVHRSNCTSGVKAQFRLFLTTKKLLKNATYTNFLNADATYKLTWENFPVLIVGTTNINRQFILIGLCLCSGETEDDFRFMFSSLQNGSLEMGADLQENIR